MTIVLGLITALSMLMLGFVLGRVWEIRREILSRPQSIDDDLRRQRRAEDLHISQEAAPRLTWARRWSA
jgi:hypothetical protein